ncbi:hypothetical protein BKA64DRAFT_704404 [Cadophora sp. MPI-SDFR-AT-0126]|nr:hypothetical protein BKA64DRAFT_704404 [Leotiomycetes sp. MPI-SDFR-AT-0126]
MQSQEVTLPPGSIPRSLRRVSGLRSLQSPTLTTQRDSMISDASTMSVALRTASPRLSQGSMVLDFTSRMLEAAAASPAIPHPVQVALQTPSPRPQSLQLSSTQNKANIPRKLSTIRHRRSNSSGYQRAGVPGESRLAKKLVPIRRHTRRVRKQSYRKAQCTLQSHTKTILKRMTHGMGKLVMQECLLSSPVDSTDKVYEIGDLEEARSSALIIETSSSEADILASRGAEGKTDPPRSTPKKPGSHEYVLLQRAQEDNHGLRMEIIRLQEETARMESRCKRDIARTTTRHEAERSRYQEENLLLREAQEMDKVSMGIRADFFEGGYKDKIRLLEASLVEERNKSSYHLAHHRHYKMMYNMERQARSSAVASPATTPIMPTEDNLWGALQEIQVTLQQVSSQVEALTSKAKDIEPRSSVSSVTASASSQVVPKEVIVPKTQQGSRTITSQTKHSIPRLAPGPEQESRSHHLTVMAAPRRADIISSSPLESADPSIEPRISDILSSGSTEKNGNELRLLALRQLLPRICTSTSPSVVAGSNGSWVSTGDTSSTSDVPVVVPYTSTERDLETGYTSLYGDTFSNVENKDDNGDGGHDYEEDDEEETDPNRLLNLSISMSTIPFSPFTGTSSSSCCTASPAPATSPIISSSIRRISIMPDSRPLGSFASPLSENGDDEGGGEHRCGAEMRHDDQAGDDGEDEGIEGVEDVSKLLLEAWDWGSVPSLDLKDFRSR